MKKHNEGYTLAMVLMVMLVLTTVSVAVLTAAVRNLTFQRDSVDRLNAQYQAQGQVERMLGELIQGTSATTVVAGEEAAVLDWLESCGLAQTQITGITMEEDQLTCLVSLTCSETVGKYIYTVDAVITVSAKLRIEKNGLENITGYTVSDVTTEYTSYEIGGRLA